MLRWVVALLAALSTAAAILVAGLGITVFLIENVPSVRDWKQSLPNETQASLHTRLDSNGRVAESGEFRVEVRRFNFNGELLLESFMGVEDVGVPSARSPFSSRTEREPSGTVDDPMFSSANLKFYREDKYLGTVWLLQNETMFFGEPHLEEAYLLHFSSLDIIAKTGAEEEFDRFFQSKLDDSLDGRVGVTFEAFESPFALGVSLEVYKVPFEHSGFEQFLQRMDESLNRFLLPLGVVAFISSLGAIFPMLPKRWRSVLGLAQIG